MTDFINSKSEMNLRTIEVAKESLDKVIDYTEMKQDKDGSFDGYWKTIEALACLKNFIDLAQKGIA